MKPLVTFADPERKVMDYLRAAFATRSEAYKPSGISTSFPSAALDNTTRLQVELEVGGAEDYPVTERAQIRVTCHAPNGRGAGDTVGGRTDVKDLASLTQGLLYAWEGDADVAGTTPLVGRSDVITDPTTKNLMVWFTFRVSLKATSLAS